MMARGILRRLISPSFLNRSYTVGTSQGHGMTPKELQTTDLTDKYMHAVDDMTRTQKIEVVEAGLFKDYGGRLRFSGR